jgi:hypothetical protein
MKQSLLTYITKIATPSKVIVTALVAVISAVSTLAMVIYNKGKADATKDNIDTAFKVEVLTAIKVMKDSVATFSPMLRMVIVNQGDMIEKQDEIKGAVNGLRGVVLDHLGKDKAMTIEQFKQYMEAAPEVKKNSMRGSTQ